MGQVPVPMAKCRCTQAGIKSNNLPYIGFYLDLFVDFFGMKSKVMTIISRCRLTQGPQTPRRPASAVDSGASPRSADAPAAQLSIRARILNIPVGSQKLNLGVRHHSC